MILLCCVYEYFPCMFVWESHVCQGLGSQERVYNHPGLNFVSKWVAMWVAMWVMKI